MMMETGEETEHNSVEHALTKILQGLDKRLCAIEAPGEHGMWQPFLVLHKAPAQPHRWGLPSKAQELAYLDGLQRRLFSKYKFNISDQNWNKTMTDNGATPNTQFKTDIENTVKKYHIVTSEGWKKQYDDSK